MTDQEMWDEAMKGVMKWQDYQERQAVKELFKKSSFNDEFKELPWYKMGFYWLKTFICLKLGRTDGSYVGDAINVHYWDHETCGTQDGTYQSWWSCWVEMGVFKNWKVVVSRDGT